MVITVDLTRELFNDSNSIDFYDGKKIYQNISKIRSESILIEVAVPGQRWEVEFMDDGSIEIEKFINDGSMYDGTELVVLFN